MTKPDLHIVIESINREGEWLHLVVVPPTDWSSAQHEWARLDQTRFTNFLGGLRATPDADRTYIVRSNDDPRWAFLPRPSVFAPTTVNLDGRGTEPLIRAAKAYAKTVGIVGKAGGWLYNVNGRPIEQGWGSYARRLFHAGRLNVSHDAPYSTSRKATVWFVWAAPRSEEAREVSPV